MSKLKLCRVCKGKDLNTFLDLGKQPWANNFVLEHELGTIEKYPLALDRCQDCATVLLNYTVPKQTMFGDHTYRSGMTKTLVNHFNFIANEINNFFDDSKYTGNRSVLDIGSNDGSFLSQFPKNWNVLGVESSIGTSKIANEAGIHTINDFYNYETAVRIDSKFDAINASGVFFHLEELDSVCRGIKLNLAENGIFVVQAIYWGAMKKRMAFDQIYHEHLLYYSLKTLQTLLEKFEIECFDVELNEIHGGSLIVKCGHKGVYQKTEKYLDFIEKEEVDAVNSDQNNRDFARNVDALISDVKEKIASRRAQGKIIYGLGAPVKGNTLINSCGFGTDDIECLVEINPARKNLYSPGSNIPVKMENELSRAPDCYLVLAWNFKDEILKRHTKDIEAGVEFIFPGEGFGGQDT